MSLWCGPISAPWHTRLVGALSLPVLSKGNRCCIRHLGRCKEGKVRNCQRTARRLQQLTWRRAQLLWPLRDVADLCGRRPLAWRDWRFSRNSRRSQPGGSISSRICRTSALLGEARRRFADTRTVLRHLDAAKWRRKLWRPHTRMRAEIILGWSNAQVASMSILKMKSGS